MMSKSRGPIPPVILLITLACQFALHYWLPVAEVIGKPWNWAGAVLIAAALLIVIGPVSSFARVKTTIRPFHDSSALVRTGMYRFTRNPMYVGMVTVLLGVGVLLGSLSPFLMPVVFVPVLNARVIRHEEKMLEERFGDEYRDFMKSVRRWI
jgi:protein-S-isoprenylcysteine O-methyltransferase Ste14